MNEELTREFSKEEMFEVLKDLLSWKAPGLDRLLEESYRSLWEEIMEAIFQACNEALLLSKLDSKLNTSQLCLIPKGGTT